ncbi:unnamed protein product [Pleuronectes platessa]|uniref:Uncharacterized protein n=1 Tax=Pleuronectes platessa TaxID=8262 RepID=A0A9N7TTK1_PLEPL|nr:unnamed protein product [Pleuronectes platessa]
MTEVFGENDPAANTAAAADTSTPPSEHKDPSRIEVVSVTEEDLPIVETPNTVNVSPLGSFTAVSLSDNNSAKPEEPQSPAPPSLTMPITKVQPFIQAMVSSLAFANKALFGLVCGVWYLLKP